MSDPSHLLQPGRRGWNVNTTVSVAGFVIVIASMVWTTAQRDADLTTLSRNFDSYRVAQEQSAKDRQSAIAADSARFDQRISILESTSRKIENLEYRVTVQEQSAQMLAQAVEEIKKVIAEQSGDLKVIREIVIRIDQRAPTP